MTILSRRSVLLLLKRGAIVLAWGCVLYPVLRFVTWRAPRSSLVVFKPEEQSACVFKDGVYLLGKGASALALSGCCSHLGCNVKWDSARRHFCCPCHRSEYDAAGRRLAGPARVGLERLEVRVRENGNVDVIVPASVATRRGHHENIACS